MEAVKVIETTSSKVDLTTVPQQIREEYLTQLLHSLTDAHIYEDLIQRQINTIAITTPTIEELTIRKIVALAPLLGFSITLIEGETGIRVKTERPVRVKGKSHTKIVPESEEVVISSVELSKLKIANFDWRLLLERERLVVELSGKNYDHIFASMVSIYTFPWDNYMAVLGGAYMVEDELSSAGRHEDLFTIPYGQPTPILGGPGVLTIDERAVKAISETINQRFAGYDVAILSQLSDLVLTNLYDAIRTGQKKSVDDMINDHRLKLASIKHDAQVRKQMDESMTLAQTYMRLLRYKIPDVVSKVTNSMNPNAILSVLTERQRKILLTEYSVYRGFIAAQANNKCDHVVVMRKLNRAKDDVSLRAALEDLQQFLPTSTAKEEVHGGDEDHDYLHCKVCSLPLICPHALAFAKLRVEHADYSTTKAALSKYLVSDIDLSNNCGICGEIISSDILEDVSPPEFVMDEELKKFVYSEVASAFRWLNVKSAINIPQTMLIIRDACYPYVFELEKKIIKSRTANADEIKAKQRVYTSIYVMAYMVHIVNTSPNVIEFKGTLPKEKNHVVSLIKYAINAVMEMKNPLFRFIPNVNIDVVKNSLIAAYKSITEVSIAEAGDLAAPSAELSMIYAWTVEELTGGKLKKLTVHDIPAKIPMVEELLTIEQGKSMYASVPETGDIIYDNFLKYMRIASEPAFVDNGIDPVTKLRIMVPNFVFGQYFEDILETSREIEKRRRRVNACTGPIYGNTSGVSKRKFVRQDVKLGRIYDANGIKHKFDQVVINKQAVPMKMIPYGAAVGCDRVCSACGVKLSETDNISEVAILDSLDKINQQDNFYKFYELRCPEGGLHEGSPCEKCKFDGRNLAYFKKYHERYTKDRANLAPKKVEKITPESDVVDLSKKYANWSYNFNSLISLAAEFGIDQKLLQALGATYGVDYSSILSGQYIPPEPETRNDTRIYTLTSYITEFTRLYNQFRGHVSNPKPTQFIIRVVEQIPVADHIKLAQLPQLSSIVKVNIADLEWFRANRKPRDIVSWLLQYLCEMLLNVVGHPGIYPGVRKLIVAYLEKIIRADMLVSKPGYFNWSLIYGEKEEKSRDSNYSFDADTHDDDDDDESPLNTSDIDMEEQDSDENQIRVEGYGLD